LEGENVERDAHRIARLQLGDGGHQVGAQLDDVAAFAHRDREHEGALAVGPHYGARRLHVAPAHVRNVAEVHRLTGLRQGDDRAPDIVDGGEVARGLEGDAFDPGFDHPTGDDDVARLENALELCCRESEAGQPRVVEVDEDALLLHPVKVDLGDILDLENGIAHLVAGRLELGVGEPVCGQRDHRAEHVAEFVVHDRNNALGQLAGGTLHLAAQVVPYWPQLGHGLANLDVDDRDPGARLARNVCNFRDLLDRALDLVGHEKLDPFG